jgi:hypothetical protein
MRARNLLIAAGASLVLACSQVATLTEPTPTELLKKATANLQAAKTAHIEGTGSFSIKSGMTLAFDFKMNGDAEVPDKSRLNVEMSLFGQSFTVETITIGGRTFTKDLSGTGWQEGAGDPTQGAMLDPLGQADLSAVMGVAEVDRPEVDGRKTRHISYSVDANKLLEKMQGAPAAASFKPSNVNGSGEVWIRTDDSQIVRQLVKLSFDIEGDLGLPISTSPAPAGKGTFEISFDLRFSKIGEPLSPAITAPPAR